MSEKRDTLLYVGGLDETCTSEILQTIFITFGEIRSVEVPCNTNGKCKGFGFVDFVLFEDAQHAIQNMNNSEILGKVVTVNISKTASRIDQKSRPVWADDEWYRKRLEEENIERGTV